MMDEHSLELLAKAGLNDVKRAQKNLELLAGTELHQEAFEDLKPKLLDALKNAPDPDMALNNLQRYADSVIDRSFLYTILKENRKVLDLALTIFGSSQYLSDILISFPHYFYWLLEPGVLRRPKPREELEAELSASISRLGSLPQKFGALRRFKRREILRVGLQDLLGNLDLAGVTQELSNLAESCLQKAYETCLEELKRRHGIPQYLDADGTPRECRFAIIGMGKLGGAELNFSSDIDLLFVYEADGETTGIEGPSGDRSGKATNHRFFTRLAELLVRAIGEVTADGHVFRIDLRLRPEGSAGDLVRSLRGYELYYESRGREWERLALIKARPVGGDLELGQAFLQMVVPFVYRRSVDYGTVAEVRALKEKINAGLAVDGRTYRDVKLGYGGIREIEFIVQTFQLLYGGQDPWIREANTLRALHRLAERRYLSYQDYALLAKAYTFLRTVEHRLQILHQLQTHTLPEDQVELQKLARRLGYRSPDSAEAFLTEHRAHTEAVRRIYDSLLQTPSVREGKDELMLFFEADLPSERLRARLAEVRFEDPERAGRTFLTLRDGPPFAHYSPESRRSLARLAPNLLQALKESSDPDLALIHFERFVSTMGARATLLALLAENPGLLTLLVHLFGLSEPLSQTLILHPELLDVLVEPDLLRREKSREELLRELEAAVKEAPEGSARLDALRRIKRAEELRMGLQELLGEAELSQVHQGLTALAEACLQMALTLSRDELASRYGLPDDSRFAILGLGKLGGGELGYGSDLDVLFVYEKEGSSRGGPTSLSHREYSCKLADRTMKILTMITKEGAAYKVDTRLRPGGQKGELAQPLSAYEAYFSSSAEVWERQAYLKLRPVAGDLAFGDHVLNRIRPLLFRDEENLAAKIAAMRKRMEEERAKGGVHVKLGSGGLVDVEFIAQFLQLRYGRGKPELWKPGTLQALGALARGGYLSEEAADQLGESYRFLRRVEERLRIAAGLNIGTLPQSEAKLRTLARRLGYEGALALERFLTDYAFHTQAVRKLYEEVFRA